MAGDRGASACRSATYEVIAIVTDNSLFPEHFRDERGLCIQVWAGFGWRGTQSGAVLVDAGGYGCLLLRFLLASKMEETP